MPNPFPPSQLDFEQILPAVYNDAGQLRVDAEITANISGAQEVIISDVDDSIKIGNGNNGPYLKVNSDGSINALVTQTLPIPGTIYNGQVLVPTAGTATQLPNHILKMGMIIQALSENSASIFIGDSDVTNIGPTGGLELQPGQALSIVIDNTNLVWVNATVNDDGVSFVGS